jgi:hypothetical protein
MSEAERKSMRRFVLPVSLGCYAAALFLPGLAAREANPYGFTSYGGFACLIWGPTTILAGWTYFRPWTANIPYLVSIFAWAIPKKPPRWFALFPLIGLALAATVFRIDDVMVNEAGHRVAVRPGIGAWLWMTSQAIFLAGFLLPAERPGGTIPSCSRLPIRSSAFRRSRESHRVFTMPVPGGQAVAPVWARHVRQLDGERRSFPRRCVPEHEAAQRESLEPACPWVRISRHLGLCRS